MEPATEVTYESSTFTNEPDSSLKPVTDETVSPTLSVEPDTQIPSAISMQLILSLVVGFTSLVTIIGNATIIYAFFTTRALKTYTNYFILNLAILDLIGGIFPMPMYGAYWILGYWPLSAPMCDLYLWVNHVTISTTSIGILIIAIDRFRSVVYPIKHFQQRNWRYAALYISTCHVISLAIWTPAIFIWPVIGGRSFPPYICQPEYTRNYAFALFAQLELFWIPFISMAVLYSKIYRVYKERMVKSKYEKKTRMDNIKPGENDSGIPTMQDKTSTFMTVKEDMGSTRGIDSESQYDGQSENSSGRLESRRMRQENNRAVRTLTFIFAVFATSGLPWAILVIIFKMCPTCIPLTLYQASVFKFVCLH